MSIDDPAAEYQNAFSEIEDAHKRSIKAFASWFAKNWKITREEWVEAYAEAAPSDEWFNGHNAGVESIDVALDSFFGDFHP
jgi:hypothetical protein